MYDARPLSRRRRMAKLNALVTCWHKSVAVAEAPILWYMEPRMGAFFALTRLPLRSRYSNNAGGGGYYGQAEREMLAHSDFGCWLHRAYVAEPKSN